MVGLGTRPIRIRESKADKHVESGGKNLILNTACIELTVVAIGCIVRQSALLSEEESPRHKCHYKVIRS